MPSLELSESEVSAQHGLGKPVDVEFVGNVAILTMRCEQNRFNVDFVNKLHRALDKVEENENIGALITVGEGKFYSNGLDLNFLGELGSTKDGQARLLQMRDEYLQPVFERFMMFPVPTIAVLNGHCYAAGAILALCHDYRMMRTDKGWFCLNEVHIGLHFNHMMEAIIRNRIPGGIVFHEAVVLGRRYTGPEGLEAGVAQKVSSPDNLMEEAMKLAEDLAGRGIDRFNLSNMKKGMYASVTQARENMIGKEDTMGVASRL